MNPVRNFSLINSEKNISNGAFIFRILVSFFILFAALQTSLDAYSQDQDVEELANNIVDSYKFLEEGKVLYKKHDYVNAKIKFQQSLIKDPENKKALRLLKLCNRKIEKYQKPNEKLRKREKDRLERKARGIFGVIKKGLKNVLSDIPAKDISTRKLTLDECIKIAMENSLPLEIAQKQIKLAKIRLWEARRKLVPTLKLKWEESSGEIDKKAYEGRRTLVEGSQPIFHGGELVFTVSQARINLEIVENDYERIKNGLILKVEKAYYSLNKAIKFIEIQRKLHEKARELNGFINRGYEAKAVSKIEFLNVSSKYNQVNFQFISAEENVSLALLMLQQAMNTEEDIDIMPTEEPEVRGDISLDDCYTLAYTNRPEMKINYLMAEYYLYEKKIMGARSWPRVDAMGAYGYAIEDFRNKDQRGARAASGHKFAPEWYVGLKVKVPFLGNTLGYSVTKERWQPVVRTTHQTETLTHSTTFGILDNLKLYSDLTESDIGFGRAKHEYNKIKQQITLEVKETFFKYKKALLQMKVAKSKVEYQRRYVEFLEAKREMDEAMISDVLEQMINLGEEEFGLLQSFTDYYIAIKSLNKAIGIIAYFDKKEG